MTDMRDAGAEGRPLYQVIIDALIERIARGELGPGAMLPAEPALGAAFGASQGTARKALIELERRGVISRRQGLGSFVTVRTPESALFQFFRLRRPDGAQVTPETADELIRRRAATEDERALLHGQPDEVFDIWRLRRVEGRLAVAERSAVSAALFPGLAERAPLPNTLYAFYQQAYACAIVRADEELTLSDRGGEARLEGDGPRLICRRRAFDLTERLVELRRSEIALGDLTYAVSLD